MVRVLLAALIAAFFMSPAAAQTCEGPQSVMQRVLDRVPGATILDPITDTELASLLRAYNEIEPVSDYKADTLTVMGAPGFSSVLLIASDKGCVVFTDQMPIPLFFRLLGRGV